MVSSYSHYFGLHSLKYFPEGFPLNGVNHTDSFLRETSWIINMYHAPTDECFLQHYSKSPASDVKLDQW